MLQPELSSASAGRWNVTPALSLRSCCSHSDDRKENVVSTCRGVKPTLKLCSSARNGLTHLAVHCKRAAGRGLVELDDECAQDLQAQPVVLCGALRKTSLISSSLTFTCTAWHWQVCHVAKTILREHRRT